MIISSLKILICKNRDLPDSVWQMYPNGLKLLMVIIIMKILKKKIIWIMARCRGDLDCDLNIFEIFEVFIPA